MKTATKLQQDYDVLLQAVENDNRDFVATLKDTYTEKELEKLASFGWENVAGEELFKILMQCRKRKMDKLFVFNEENIRAIVHIDDKLKNNCDRLQKEIKSEIYRLLERKKSDINLFPHIQGHINIHAGEPMLDCALSYNECLLWFSRAIFNSSDIEKINQLKIFDFATNYADKIGTNKNELAGRHIGYAFYTLYSESYLSLQDIVEIVTVEGEINLRYRL